MRDSFKWLLITIVSGRPPAPLNPHNPGVTSAAKGREGAQNKGKNGTEEKMPKKKELGTKRVPHWGSPFRTPFESLEIPLHHLARRMRTEGCGGLSHNSNNNELAR